MKNLDTTLSKNKQNNIAITPGKGIGLLPKGEKYNNPLALQQVKTNITMETLLLETEEGIRKIRLSELIRIVYKGNCLAFFLNNETRFITGNFDHVLRILPAHFLLINNDTVINMHRVEKIRPFWLTIILEDGSRHKISVWRLAFFYKAYVFKGMKVMLKIWKMQLTKLK